MKVVRVVTATAILLVLVYYGSKYIVGKYEKDSSGQEIVKMQEPIEAPQEVVELMATEEATVEEVTEPVKVAPVYKPTKRRYTPTAKEDVLAQNTVVEENNYTASNTVSSEYEDENFDEESNWEHRVSAGIQTSYDREKTVSTTTRDNAHRSIPRVDYRVTYRTEKDIKSPYWIFGLGAGINNKFDIDYVKFPIDANVQVSAARHLPITGSSMYFNPTVAYKFDTNSVIGVSGTRFDDKNIYTNWIGFVSEFVLGMGKHFFEILPYVYKSFYSEVDNTRLGGWESGAKANLILTYNIDFLATAEYSYRSLITSGNDLRYISHNIILGVGTRF